MKPWSLEEVRTLRRMAPVASAAAIGAALGRTPGAVRTRAYLHEIPLMKRGVLRHQTGCPHPMAIRAAVALAWLSGVRSRADLARQYDVSWTTIDRWVNS